MLLERLQLHGFRNFRRCDYRPGPRFNLLVGANGQGKTNLLEAVYLLGTLKSFRPGKNRDLIGWQASQAGIHGTVRRDRVSHDILLVLAPDGKRARVDQKTVERLVDFFGHLNAVVFAPDDLGMVKGEPAQRRRYLDRAIFGGDPGYLQLHQEYTGILRQRNALLRHQERQDLAVWSAQLSGAAERLTLCRQRFLAEFVPLVSAYHRRIAGVAEEAGIAFRCSGLGSEPATAAAYLAALERQQGEELRRGTTLLGPHRDDLEFTLGGRPLRLFGSQGQQKSFVLALKMAEIAYLTRCHGAPPILLLDDVAAELDEERNHNLLAFLREQAMQVFITTTSRQLVPLEQSDDIRTCRINAGSIAYEDQA